MRRDTMTPPFHMQLKNRVALIIGGGSGLGRAVAKIYAREGASLAVADIQEAAAAETLGLAKPAEPGKVIRADISTHDGPKQVVQETVSHFGRLEIMVNCAAILLVDPLLEVSPEKWEKVFSINCKGAFFCMQEAARVMIPRKFGRIINISSPASKMAFPLFASYAASKAAVDSFSRAAAVAWAPHGITVNTIAPGRMTGGMIVQLEKDLARATGRTEEEMKAAQVQGLPMGRRVDPEEVAEAAVWLASDPAAYVTGERFNFTGGMEVA